MRSLALALVLLLAASSNTFAATATTAITGKVMSGGAPSAGVTVTAKSPALQGERTTVTTANGRYWLTALPAGEYEVTFSRGGMQTLIKSAEVEVARVTRVDAVLEPSEDEESVTSTAKVVGVSDTTVIASHFDDKTLDRLPFRRDPIAASFLAPGTGFGNVYQDDAHIDLGVGDEESLEQVTVLRGALTPDHEFAPAIVYARTRSGDEEFSFSLRDTLTSDDWLGGGYNPAIPKDDGLHHLFEGAAGGRVIPDKLWFFTHASYGEEWFGYERRGLFGKLTAQPATEHNLTASYDRGEVGVDGQYESRNDLVSLRYLGTIGPRWTNEAVASHSTAEVDSPNTDGIITAVHHTSFFGKSTYVLGTRFGDHILSAGAQQTNDEFFDNTSVFANDRWVWNRWTMNLGLRHDDDGFKPRVAASFDVNGDGRHAVIASLSDYTFGLSSGRDLILGYASALGNSGMARVDVIRRDFGPIAFEALTFELRYGLFDRFQAAANYLWQDADDRALTPRHTANGWITVALPVGTHEFAVTALQRYRSEVSRFFGDEWTTDVALRYALPISRVGLTLAADVTNVFDQRVVDFAVGRTYRGWVRVGL